MKKVVVKLDIQDEKSKQKAMKAVSSIPGIDSIAMNMKERKMTVIGDVDPVKIASKLRKVFHADIVSVGPAKEPEKKDEAKKEEPKKEEAKKEEPKPEEAKKEEDKKEEPKKEEEKKEEVAKDEGKKKEEPKKDEEKKKDPNEHILELINSYRAYNPHMTTHYYVQSAEENPNSCVIS